MLTLLIFALLFVVLLVYNSFIIGTINKEKKEEVAEKRIWRKLSLKFQKENDRLKSIVDGNSKSVKKRKRKYKKLKFNK